jgi:hypothetical protein
VCVAWLAASLSATVARGDGPHVVLHESAGPYEVTVFAAPAPLVVGPVLFSVLVENSDGGAQVGDARVHGWLRGVNGGEVTPLVFRSEAGGGLPVSEVKLASPGSYRVELAVTRGGAPPATVTGEIGVGANHSRGFALGVGVGLPLLCAALFLLNQAAKQRAVRSRG